MLPQQGAFVFVISSGFRSILIVLDFETRAYNTPNIVSRQELFTIISRNTDQNVGVVTEM